MSSFSHGLLDALGFARADAPSRDATPAGYQWQQMGGNRIPPTDAYDNVFPYVNAIAQRFSTLVPYAVDSELKRIDPTPQAVRALYAPNDLYSCREFLRYIAASMLTQSHLDVLVWTGTGGQARPGGKITPDNIAGYTFLPQDSRQYDSNRADWYHRVTMNLNGMTDTYEFSRAETIALTYSVHPIDPTRGISPAMTIRKWATVDDMIADYERGFFGNGAVPAGMLGIVSNTAEDFSRNRRRLEDTFRGAGKNNGVVYNWIPVDPLTRKPSEGGKLVWVPFQQSNNTLDLATLDGVVNKRLANALAVPDIVRGIDNGQTYANAEMAERTFIENTLQPLALTVWDKWQFELDRITGGLDYAITFDLDLPAQTDVEKVQADKQAVQVDTLIKLVQAGADTRAACHALGLPDSFAALTLAPATATPAIAPAETPAVPELTRTSAGTSFARIDPAEKKAYDATVKAYKAIVTHETRQTNAAGDDNDDDWTDEIITTLIAALGTAYASTILDYAAKTGAKVAEAINAAAATNPAIAKAVADIDLVGYTDWDKLPDDYRKAYAERLTHVATDTVVNGVSKVRDILAKADAESWEPEDTRRALEEFVDGNRAKLLARNELVNAQRLGDYYSAKAFHDNLGLKMRKKWYAAAADPCEFCKYMNGKTIDIDADFMKKGESITINGKTYVNDWMTKTTCDGHPNCRCTCLWEVLG